MNPVAGAYVPEERGGKRRACRPSASTATQVAFPANGIACDHADSDRFGAERMSRVLGLDIGGTSTRARLVADGEIVADVTGGSASLTAAGEARAAAALDDLLGQLPGPAGRLDAVCAGAAGSHTAAQQTSDFLQARLAPMTRSSVVLVVDDASLILPAARLAEGIAVICGTGSIATGTWRGREAWAGGWGYLLGDEGSGYWMVRSAIRALLSRRTRGAPPGELGGCLLGAASVADLDALRAEFYRQPEPANWARHAPAILDCADPEVGRIAFDAAMALADLAAEVSGQLGVACDAALASQGADPGPLPVVLAGGLMTHQRLQTLTIAAVAAALQGSPVQLLREPPVAGAVRLAEAAADTVTTPRQ
jgi:glucosamine kinase